MQTKQQIQQLLASSGVSLNKRLGQHFLIDLNLMRLLVRSASIRDNDIVLEVGCGTGSLTEALAQHAGKVIAVELDRTLAEIAKRQLVKSENVYVINTDVLKNKSTINTVVANAIELARRDLPDRILLVANLPYNVASPVMLNLVAGPTIVDQMYVTVQKEVADRMTAAPGSSNYGTLSILLSATGEVKTIRTLKATVFWPKPQVDSAMVSFVRKNEKLSKIQSMQLFSQTIGLFMGHRRKTLRACTKLARGQLARIERWPEILEQCAIDPKQRPEQLPPQDYVSIANLCSGALKRQE